MKVGGLCMAADLADVVTIENRRGWNKQNIIKTVNDNHQTLEATDKCLARMLDINIAGYRHVAKR